jgi:hypothetical protein
VQLGLENKKQATWAAVLGVVAVLSVAYFVLPLFMGGPSSEPGSSAQAAAPAPRVTARPGGRAAKKVKVENLDPTLRLDLLASSEEKVYQGTGRNIFVARPEDVVIPTVVGKANTDPTPGYVPPQPPAPTPIPLKFFGFASKPGEPKKVFLSLGEELFVAGEGEIVNRRYKVIHINATSVEMQDVVNSGPPQNIPLTQG